MSKTLRVEALFMQAGISILGVETEACSPPGAESQGLVTNIMARISGAKLKNGKLSFPFWVGVRSTVQDFSGKRTRNRSQFPPSIRSSLPPPLR